MKAKDDKDKVEQSLDDARHGEGVADSAIHDVASRGREKKRIDVADKNATNKDITLRIPTTDETMTVTPERWQAERQILRQAGWEKADALPADEPGDGGS